MVVAVAVAVDVDVAVDVAVASWLAGWLVIDSCPHPATFTLRLPHLALKHGTEVGAAHAEQLVRIDLPSDQAAKRKPLGSREPHKRTPKTQTRAESERVQCEGRSALPTPIQPP